MQLARRALRRDIGSSSSSYGKTAAQLDQQVDARAAETTRRTRDGSTAAQHDQNVNVAAPAMRAAEVARNTRDGITAAQHNARATIQAPAMRAAEVERRARYGSTAAQLDQCIDWQEAGSMAFQ